VVLVAVLGFFALEKLLVWRHCHVHGCGSHSASAPLVLFGDGVHNFLDGVAIAVAFSESFPLGLATSLAVIAHEIPQEVGDVFILVNAGYSKLKAVVANTLGSLTTLLGGLAGLWFARSMEPLIPYALAVSGASFLYVALADLTPGHRKRAGLSDTLVQFACIGLGVAFIASVHRCPH
jgi:zinc and cadmium transporter